MALLSIICLLAFYSTYQAHAGSVFTVPDIVQERQADLLILTTPELIDSPSLRKLAQWRATNDDFDVALLSTEMFHLPAVPEECPPIIRDALRWACKQWSALHTPSLRPEYVLLVGDHEQLPGWELPHPVEDTNEVFITDAPYTEFEGKRISLALGRLPASTEGQLQAIVSKIIKYESESKPAEWHQRLLYASEFNYSRSVAALEQQIAPAGFSVQRVVANEVGYEEATQTVIGALQDGALLTYYHWHGQVTGWRLLPNGRVDEIEEIEHLSILVAEACSSAQFANLGHDSLGERVLWMPYGGAVAYIGATIEIYGDAAFLPSLTTAILGKHRYRVGDMLRHAQTTVAPEFMSAIVLLGDPAMRLAGVASLSALPDLAIGFLDITPSADSLLRHESAEIQLTVHNLGGIPARSVPLHLSDKLVGSASSRPLADLVIPYIGPHSREKLDITVHWDDYDEVGEHQISAQLDPNHAIEEACEWNNQTATVITVDKGMRGWPRRYSELLAAPIAADLNGDGRQEIVLVGSKVHVIQLAEDGSQIAATPFQIPFGNCAPAAVGDIDGDRQPEIVIGYVGYIGHGKHLGINILRADLTPVAPWPLTLPQHPKTIFANAWEAFNRTPAQDAVYPFLADLDGDSDLEVLALFPLEDGCAIYAWQETGELISGWPQTVETKAYSYPAVGDLDGDTDMEVVLAAARQVFVWDQDAKELPGWPVDSLVGTDNLVGPVLGLALGDMDGDGRLEVLVRGSRYLGVWAATGQPVHGSPLEAPFNRFHGNAVQQVFPVSLGDLNGDGLPEAVSNHVFMLGQAPAPLPMETGVSALSIADLDGNSAPNLTYTTMSHLVATDVDGEALPGWPERLQLRWGWYAPPLPPLIVDLNGDGESELCAVDRTRSSSSESGVYLWAVGGKFANRQWPMFQHDSLHSACYGMREVAPLRVTAITTRDVEQDDGGRIHLEWAAVADTSEYCIYRADTPDADLTLIGRSRAPSYRDNSVNSGRPMRYMIRSYAGWRVSQASVEAVGQAFDDLSPSGSPTVPTEVTAVASEDHALLVQWREIPDRDVAGYRIEWRQENAESSAFSSVQCSYGTQQLVRGLEHDLTCSIRVIAVDADGNQSIPTIPIQAIPEDDDQVGPTFPDLANEVVSSDDRIFIWCRIKDPSGIYDDATGSEGQGAHIRWDTDGELTRDARETQLEAAGLHFRTIAPIHNPGAGGTITYQVHAWDDDADGGDALDRTEAVSDTFEIRVEGTLQDLIVYPNPVRGDQATVKYYLPQAADVTIRVFSVSGSVVANVAARGEGHQQHRATWDTEGLAPGVYVLLLDALFGDGSHEVVKHKVAVSH